MSTTDRELRVTSNNGKVPVKLRRLAPTKFDEYRLVEGSHLFNADLSSWVSSRFIFLHCINKSGTFIDVGCANGLLARTIIELSSLSLIPYGIDVDANAITKAKRILRDYASNFECIDLINVTNNLPKNFPMTYDYVLWSIWDNFDRNHPYFEDYIKQIRELVSPDGNLLAISYLDHPERQEKLSAIESILGNPKLVVFQDDTKQELWCW